MNYLIILTREFKFCYTHLTWDQIIQCVQANPRSEIQTCVIGTDRNSQLNTKNASFMCVNSSLPS